MIDMKNSKPKKASTSKKEKRDCAIFAICIISLMFLGGSRATWQFLLDKAQATSMVVIAESSQNSPHLGDSHL